MGVLSTYSGRISKLLSASGGRLKVIFHDFPGGAANFEAIARFCYNGGRINISPYNIDTLTCAAHFMKMNKSVSARKNLCERMEKSLEEIKSWGWSEVLGALKQCHDLCPEACSTSVIDKCSDSLISRIASSCEVSPCPSISSSDSSGIRLSCDTRSTESSKNSSFRTIWWFEDFLALDTSVIRALVKMMIARNFDHGIISRFLFYYQKARLVSAPADQKIKIMETVIDMLECLDIRLVSYKMLFHLLRVGVKLNLSTSSRDKIESMIGLQLDQATLDNLLVPSPVRTSYLYDVNLVLRLVKSFLSKGVCCVPLSRLKKVANVMDLYLAEVAPDPCLKTSKFFALMEALPESARDCYDGVYDAISLYLQVHSGLCEEQKMRLCLGLNYEKLSSGALNHLVQNPNFPPKLAVGALIWQQRKLRSLLFHSASKGSTSTSFSGGCVGGMEEEGEGSKQQQIVVYAKKVARHLGEKEMMEAAHLHLHLEGMQWRVVELEKVCRKMQVRMRKMMMMKKKKQMQKSTTRSNTRAMLPKLCS
ncbi:BTB/POZ domain-containing protein At3g22104 isoform X2 [Andrographis paniculata]|uniref:BTB/POZ domain-containing protein At3g22104 isoform X2 n=1 Tax=Andrographis paniculata TaxID=175694 RepID=UPI0021E82492|nr:BTB/POZ domain-containing protein At3g22104 isoform X2 [Andrographis paniculata]